MAIIDLGKVSITWRGAYDGSTAYTPKDAVSYQNASYICTANTTGNLPTDTSYWNVMAAKGVDGTDIGTTLTTQGDILYRDGSGLQRLAAGTSGQFLKTQGSGANPVWSTLTDAPVTRLLDVDVTTTVSHIDLSLGSLDQYVMVKIIMEDLSVDTSGVDVYCGVMQGSTPAYSSIQHEYIANTGGSAISSGSTIGGRINGGGLNASDSKWCGEFNWIGLSSGMRPSGWGHATYLDGSNNRQGCQGFYQMTANENGVTGFRILGQSDNFRGQGKITVFGYKHS